MTYNDDADDDIQSSVIFHVEWTDKLEMKYYINVTI